MCCIWDRSKCTAVARQPGLSPAAYPSQTLYCPPYSVLCLCAGPVTILQWSFPRADVTRREQAEQLALALREEVADLEAAGCRVLQVSGCISKPSLALAAGRQCPGSAHCRTHACRTACKPALSCSQTLQLLHSSLQVDEPALREGLPLKASRHAEYLQWAVNAFRLATGCASPSVQVSAWLGWLGLLCKLGAGRCCAPGIAADPSRVALQRSPAEWHCSCAHSAHLRSLWYLRHLTVRTALRTWHLPFCCRL